MPSFVELIQQSSAHAWLFIPSAILLGALHGLEPGHSKTMMAAFIVAIRGTVSQAVLLGLAATVSHTLVVWAIALGGMYLWQGLDVEATEPYFQLASAFIIIGLALWMLWRTWDDQNRARREAGHSRGEHGHAHSQGTSDRHGHAADHGHGHDHRGSRDHGHGHVHGESVAHVHAEGHGHVDSLRGLIDTGHDLKALELHVHADATRWRIRSESGAHWDAAAVTLEAERPDGRRESFTFSEHGGFLESVETVRGPHRFLAHLRLNHGDHAHDYDVRFNDQIHARRIDTGHGLHAVELEPANEGNRIRISTERGQAWAASEVTAEAERPDGRRFAFTLQEGDGFFISKEILPLPADFMLRVRIHHGDHAHDYDVSFLAEEAGSDHMHEELRGLKLGTDGYQDAHELAHANDIRRRFADQNVTTWQIVLFGLTGGLIPCPAAVTVLLLCLQLKEIPLGAVLVLCFSIGLAITLVAVGAVAALSVRHAAQRWSWFSTAARRAPYFSSVLIILVGLYVGYHGLAGLTAAS